MSFCPAIGICKFFTVRWNPHLRFVFDEVLSNPKSVTRYATCLVQPALSSFTLLVWNRRFLCSVATCLSSYVASHPISPYSHCENLKSVMKRANSELPHYVIFSSFLLFSVSLVRIFSSPCSQFFFFFLYCVAELLLCAVSLKLVCKSPSRSRHVRTSFQVNW
jgi:hypothetical protein